MMVSQKHLRKLDGQRDQFYDSDQQISTPDVEMTADMKDPTHEIQS